jgi:hypothetical protein
VCTDYPETEGGYTDRSVLYVTLVT